MGHSVSRASGSSLGVLGILARRRVGLICRGEAFVADGILGDRSLLWAERDAWCRLWRFTRHRAEVVVGLIVGLKLGDDSLSPVVLCRETRFRRQVSSFWDVSHLVDDSCTLSRHLWRHDRGDRKGDTGLAWLVVSRGCAVEERENPALSAEVVGHGRVLLVGAQQFLGCMCSFVHVSELGGQFQQKKFGRVWDGALEGVGDLLPLGAIYGNRRRQWQKAPDPSV